MRANVETTRWSKRYRTALQRYLKAGEGARLSPALRLGRDAVGLGLGTLDLAHLHESALVFFAQSGDAALASPKAKGRAATFFGEVLVPVEKTHRGAVDAAGRAERLGRTLHERTRESTASTKELARSLSKRETAEAALQKSVDNRARLLEWSSALEARWVKRTRHILEMQEDARRKASARLQNEIAQTLIGVGLGLLALEESAKTDGARRAKDVAKTQRLVRASLRKVMRYRP